jgi:hypothetical protein
MARPAGTLRALHPDPWIRAIRAHLPRITPSERLSAPRAVYAVEVGDSTQDSSGIWRSLMGAYRAPATRKGPETGPFCVLASAAWMDRAFAWRASSMIAASLGRDVSLVACGQHEFSTPRPANSIGRA